MANASMILRSSSTAISAPYAPSTRLAPATDASACRLGASFRQPELRLRSFCRSPDSVHRRKFLFFSTTDDSGYLSLGLKGDEAEGTDEDEADLPVNESKNLKQESADEKSQEKDVKETAEKYLELLRDTTEQLKEKAEQASAALQPLLLNAQEQAEKARATIVITATEKTAVLVATVQETAEKSKENISYIVENAPEPIRDIAETALEAHSTSIEAPGRFSKIHDFCLGIPYGASLVAGGLLWFVISGSTAGIRFGVILGGILLALSVQSLKAWKKGQSSSGYIKAQAAITSIIMIREVRRLFQATALPTAVIALASVGMLGFYAYVYLAGGNPPKKQADGSQVSPA